MQEMSYQQSVATKSESLKCFLAYLAYFGLPDSLIDLGCGDGHLVVTAARLGIKSIGYDCNLNRDSVFINGSLKKLDLLQSFPWDQVKADTVLCWELAEHLPINFSDELVEIITKITENTLVFTAAVPGQGGSGHINEQDHEYWRARFIANGFSYNSSDSITLSQMWDWCAPNAWWYSKNVQVFRCM
jgi:hypothetical protein